MANEQPTAGDSGASSADPIDRIQKYLDAQDGGSTGEAEQSDDPQSAAKTPDKPDEDAREKDDGPQFTTTHLAQHLGLDESAIDVDDTGQPVFKTKVDGKESTVKFNDLLKSYQLQGHAENTTRAAAEIQKAAQARMQEAEQVIQQRIGQQQDALNSLGQMTAILNEELQGEKASINWDALWQADPAQARQLERRFEAREARINATNQQLHQRNMHLRQQAEWQMHQQSQAALQQESGRLLEVIPEWNDATVRSKEAAEVRAWAESRGYDPMYLENVHLGRVPGAASIVRDMRLAWQHDTLRRGRPDVENRVRTAPRLVKPGQAQQADSGSATLKSLKHNVKSTSGGNSTKALAAWLEASGKA